MILYHYTTGKGVFGIINSAKLHCSNVKFLNDPSEETYSKSLLKMVLKDCKECESIFSNLYNESYQEAICDPYEKYIASFSRNQDSLSMWNYYSKGNGYNIGVDISSIIKRNANRNLSIQKIDMVYDMSNQLDMLKKSILTHLDGSSKYLELDELLKSSANESLNYEYDIQQFAIVSSFNEDIFEMMLKLKHHAFESEQETRLIVSQTHEQEKDLEYKVSVNGVFIEFISLDLNLSEDIKSITTHPLNAELHTLGTLKFLSSKVKNNKIDVLPSNIPFRVV